jgi:hypothetical protein
MTDPFFDVTNRNGQRSIRTAEGLSFQGEFDLICRDVTTGDVAWEATQKNIMTTYGLQYFAFTGFGGNARIGFTPSKEQPLAVRSGMSTDYPQVWQSGNVSWVVTPSTYTKQMSTTFTTPASPRTLGSVYISVSQIGLDLNSGPWNMLAYSLLTPFRTQATTQTIEVVYRISVTPVL